MTPAGNKPPIASVPKLSCLRLGSQETAMIGPASRQFLFKLCVIFVLASLTWAKGNPDITQFGHDIRVEPGQKVGDVTCFNCSIYVRGEATSDLTAFHGDILIGENAV